MTTLGPPVGVGFDLAAPDDEGAGVVTGVALVVVVAGGSLTGVAVEVLVVVVCAGVSGAGVVVVEVSVEVVGSLVASAARATPVSGPPSPTTVKPPPASTETTARRARERVPFTSDIPSPCSSCLRPMVAYGQGIGSRQRPPYAIHIGREARLGKGFVIGPCG